MGTTLWHVKVSKVEGDTVRLAVNVADADAGPFEKGNAFVLRMLFEPATELDDDYRKKALGPLGEALDDDKIYDDDWLAKNGGKFLKSVELTNVVNADVDRASSQAKIEKALVAEGKKKRSKGFDELVNERLRDFWSNPKNLPSAVYVIRATDKKWLAHLKPGMKWNSAAFA
jgi:hypothetical protein